MKTKRLRNTREAGLVLPQSGYEISNEEMMYVDGGWFWRRLFTAIAVAVTVTVVVVATAGVGAAVVAAAGAKKAAAAAVAKKTIIPAGASGTALGIASGNWIG